MELSAFYNGENAAGMVRSIVCMQAVAKRNVLPLT
jgi:hypothetical protein